MSLLIFQQEQSNPPWGKVSVKLWFSGMSLSYFMAFHKHCITEDDGDSVPTWVLGFLFLFSIINSLTRTFHVETSFLFRDSTVKHSAGCDIVVFGSLVKSWVCIENLLEEKNFYK